jgi:hypothetical protein
MPVSSLYVEGKADERILKASLSLLPNNPNIERKGSKDDLPHLVRRDRQNPPGLAVVYLRDRDFDTEPVFPTPSQPEPILSGGTVHGYRWQRHEIESYLLTPELVHEAFKIEVNLTEAALLAAAAELRDYQAARWTIGQTRKACRAGGSLRTRYPGTGEFQLPADLSQDNIWNWLHQETSALLHTYQQALDPDSIAAMFAGYQQRLSALTTAEEILLWYSPKDLLSAESFRAAWMLSGINPPHPADFSNKIARWLEKGNGLRFFQLIPEAQALADLLTS